LGWENESERKGKGHAGLRLQQWGNANQRNWENWREHTVISITDLHSLCFIFIFPVVEFRKE
jgi:hypothetical protein